MKRVKIMVMLSVLLSFVACVKEEPVTIEFKGTEYQMLVGESKSLRSELVIKNTADKPVLSSSNSAVASVDESGKVTAVAAGEVTVTAEVAGQKATCRVKVAEVKAESLVINAPKTLEVDVTRSVTVTTKPASFNKENLVWEFTASDETLRFETTKVSASEYEVRFTTFVKNGKLMVKVSDSNSALTQTAEIEVAKGGVPAANIELSFPDQITETLWTSVKATVEPADYELENLEWEFVPTSDNLGFKYEKVSDAEYKVSFSSYVKDGAVTVMVTDIVSSKFAQGTISVRQMPVGGLTKLSLSPEALRLKVDDEPVSIKVITEPADYDPLLLKWASADEKVVTVKDGVITVVGEGQTTVTVEDVVSKKVASCVVAVVPVGQYVSIKRIDLDRTNLQMRVSEEDVQLVATCYDENGNVVENYPELEWSAPQGETADGKITVVEVSQQGVVTAVNAGTTQVIVRDKILTNIKAICNVSVAPAPIRVQKVQVIPEAKVISVGKTFTLNTVVSPEDAEDKTLTYSSSNSAVATVDAQGVVTAVANGTTYVRATAPNGVYGECEVTVADTWVEFNTSAVTLVVGEERTLTAKVMPETIDGGDITWSSSDEKVVSIDQNGNIKGLAAGESEIKVVTSKGIEGVCPVRVVNDFDIVFVVKEDITKNGVHQFESFEIGVEYTNDYIPQNATWEVSDPSALKVTEMDGKYLVEATYEGTIAKGENYPVTLTHKAGKKEKVQTIKILPAVPKQIILTSVPEVDGVPYKMLHGQTFKFEAKILPEQASQEVALQGGGYLSVPDNTYKATTLGLQNFTIYAPGHTDVKHNFSIEVLPIRMTDMLLSSNDIELQAGSIAAIAVTFVPENASQQNLEWTSSDEAVATVDQHGTVTALSAGNAVITATQPENNISRTCNVTVTEPASAGPAVGDYYYSDGTTSTSLDASKTVIGVVFSVNNPTLMGDAELVSDHAGCTHGYVVSTVEYAGQDFGSVSNQNGHGYYDALGYDANLIVDMTKANGYGNSKAHKALNASNSSYVQMFNATDGVVATHASAVAAPESASGWYVPSYKEMQMLNENREAVNAALSASGGTPIAEPYKYEDSWDNNRSSDWYWTSTIYGKWVDSVKSYDHYKYPYDLSKNGWTTTQQSFAKCKVRIILAF